MSLDTVQLAVFRVDAGINLHKTNPLQLKLRISKMSKRSGNRKGQKGQAFNGRRGALIAGKRNPSELSMVVEPWMPLFPARTTKWLRYSADISLSSSSGAVSTYVFAANDLFDPDRTGTGHQPMGFDQMMIFYNHFCVTHCKAKIIFKSAAGATGTACVRQDASSTPITVIDQILEIGGLVQTTLETIGGFGANKEIEIGLSVAKLQGVSETALTADSTLRGNAAASPTEVTYFHLQLWNAAGVTCTANVAVLLEFRAIFMEPRDATESLKAIARGERKEPFVEVPSPVICHCSKK